jgi:hypothetical protein
MEIMKRNPNPMDAFRQMGVKLQKYLRLYFQMFKSNQLQKVPS